MNIETNVLVIKEICHFIKTKCSLMNEGNFKNLSEMIISDVNSIESKLHQPTVIGTVCENPHCDDGITSIIYGEKEYCHICRDKQSDL
jgi:hypothetical protein